MQMWINNALRVNNGLLILYFTLVLCQVFLILKKNQTCWNKIYKPAQNYKKPNEKKTFEIKFLPSIFLNVNSFLKIVFANSYIAHCACTNQTTS